MPHCNDELEQISDRLVMDLIGQLCDCCEEVVHLKFKKLKTLHQHLLLCDKLSIDNHHMMNFVSSLEYKRMKRLYDWAARMNAQWDDKIPSKPMSMYLKNAWFDVTRVKHKYCYDHQI